MRFWESSALVALVVEQRTSVQVRALEQEGLEAVAWVLSDVEVRSAIERLAREGVLTPDQARHDIQDSETVWRRLRTIDLVDAVKLRAKRLLSRHALRAADAMQLGAALLVAEDVPEGLEFVTLDDRLAEAARREGFRVLP